MKLLIRQKLLPAATVIVFWTISGSVLAQNEEPPHDPNPAGNTGALKSQITTGGSYDAHTGNGTRAVTDLKLPGALGEYGLNFTRYWNSLAIGKDWPPGNPEDFGPSGWTHSWRWEATYNTDPQDGYCNTSITITFPDGHTSRYTLTRDARAHGTVPGSQSCGPPYNLPSEANWTDPAGPVHDHLEMTTVSGSEFWLYLADGGAVHFTGDYASQVFDPHGFRTDLSYDGNGHLTRVEQEGGRWLTLTWTEWNSSGRFVITRVESGGNAGVQWVDYGYTAYPHPQNGTVSPALSSVTYYDDPLPGQTSVASYSYEDYVQDVARNITYSGPRMIRADDPRYEGPMRTIRYIYRGTSTVIAEKPSTQPYWQAFLDYFYADANSIDSEQSDDHQTVSHFQHFSGFSGIRQEFNGLGGSRTFYFGWSSQDPNLTYNKGYQLVRLTDFGTSNGNVPYQSQTYFGTIAQDHPHKVWDGRNIMTEYLQTPGDDTPESGEVHHIDGSSHIYDRIHPGESAARDTTRIHNPFNHWLFSETDEKGFTTIYKRDARRRVTDITYAVGTLDQSTEHFDYNDLNQVTSHQLASGAVKTYEYHPASHRLLREYNSVEGYADRKEYEYDELDRVWKEQNGRARSVGKPFSTRMTYNGRHKMLTLEYCNNQAEPNGKSWGTDVMYEPEPNPTVTYEYDTYGNCTAITDELSHRRTYEYDGYRRCTKYIEPLDSANGSSREWQWFYDRVIDGRAVSAAAHTSEDWRVQVEPAYNDAGDRRVTVREYDCNQRMVSESTGLSWAANAPSGTWTSGPDTETHYFTYDENGQKQTSKDPLEHITAFTYDSRNRPFEVKEPLNPGETSHITKTEYDFAGNKTKVTFPDQRTQEWIDYDTFGQPKHFKDERGNLSDFTYKWGPMQELATVTTRRSAQGPASEPQVTTFTPDLLGRTGLIQFPDGTTYEQTTYSHGDVLTWRTRRGSTRTSGYDFRGREISTTWSDSTPGVTTGWDDANRIISLWNIYSSIDFAYDDANQLRAEGDHIAGTDRTEINYVRYAGGRVSRLEYPKDHFAARQSYNARGQLQSIDAWTYVAGFGGTQVLVQPVTSYIYRKDGKLDHQANGDGGSTQYGYDERAMMQSVAHRNQYGQTIAERTYVRDTRDRIKSAMKGNHASVNPMENGRGDFYGYDPEGQLTDAWYEAVPGSTPSPTPTPVPSATPTPSPGGTATPTPTPTMQVAPVVIAGNLDESTVTMSCATSGATIYYTVRNMLPYATPAPPGGTAYSQPVSQGACAKRYYCAVATKAGMTNSEVSTQTVQMPCGGNGTDGQTEVMGAVRAEMFFYDAMGNREGSNTLADRGATLFSQNSAKLNQYGSWPVVISYDTNGALTNEGSFTATFNALNQPVSIYRGGNSYTWFGYDPLGRCVKRWIGASGAAGTNPATYYYYDGWNLIEEGSGADNIQRRYVHGARVDEIVAEVAILTPTYSTFRYHYYDAQGNCLLLTDESGNLVEQYSYDAFGKPYFYNASNGWSADVGSSTTGNRFLFQGREWLADPQLYDFRHRLYHPELGRFIQPDPKEFEAGDYNLYRYCHNDPVNKSDPTGLRPDAPEPGPESEGMIQGSIVAAGVLAAPIAYEAAGNALLSVAARVPFVARLIGAAAGAGETSRRAFSESISRTQKDLLGQMMGNGVKGATEGLSKLQSGGSIPQGLSRQTLETYAKIAQATIAANKDPQGTQAARLKLIDTALKKLK